MPVDLTKAPHISANQAMSTLFDCLAVGLEGCPTFEHLPDDEAILPDDTFYHVGGGQTRAVKIEGTVYHITVSKA